MNSVRIYRSLRSKKKTLIVYGMESDDAEYHPVVKKLKRKLAQAVIKEGCDGIVAECRRMK